MLAVSVPSASAALTVSATGGVMRVVDSSYTRHSMLIDDDGTSRVFVFDPAQPASNTVAGSGCVKKTVGGAQVVSCPRSLFYKVYVTLGAQDDFVNYQVNTGSRIDADILLWTGNDGAQGPATGTSSSIPFMTIYGGIGDDNLTGGKSFDGIYGGDGNDRIDGFLASDALYGEVGNDEIFARDSSRDTVDCGENLGDNDLAHIDNNNLDSLIGSSCERTQTF